MPLVSFPYPSSLFRKSLPELYLREQSGLSLSPPSHPTIPLLLFFYYTPSFHIRNCSRFFIIRGVSLRSRPNQHLFPAVPTTARTGVPPLRRLMALLLPSSQTHLFSAVIYEARPPPLLANFFFLRLAAAPVWEGETGGRKISRRGERRKEKKKRHHEKKLVFARWRVSPFSSFFSSPFET